MTTGTELPSLPDGSVARAARTALAPWPRPAARLARPGVGARVRIVVDPVTRLVVDVVMDASSGGTARATPVPPRLGGGRPALADLALAALGAEVTRVARDRARPGHHLGTRRDVDVVLLHRLRSGVAAKRRVPAGRPDLARSGRRDDEPPPSPGRRRVRRHHRSGSDLPTSAGRARRRAGRRARCPTSRPASPDGRGSRIGRPPVGAGSVRRPSRLARPA